MTEDVRPVVKEFKNSDGTQSNWLFYCPGCKEVHPYSTPRWQFNGDPVKPTFSPSLVCSPNDPKRCHLWVRNGVIEYCSDSWHELKGKTVPMVPWEDEFF